MNTIERFASLLECGTEAAWRDAIFQFGQDHGYEQTLFAVVPNRLTPLERAFLRSNYSPQWRETYDASKLLHIDPTVTHCVSRSTPMIWEPGVFASKSQKEMYEEASSHGLRSGITLPFHGANGEIGMLCFVTDAKPCRNFTCEALHSMPLLSLMRDFTFEASLRFAMPSSNTEQPPSITRRELECLKWCAVGKSSWDIAQILHCSEAAVNFHFSNLRRKFDATSRRQCLVKAIRWGLIHPS